MADRPVQSRFSLADMRRTLQARFREAGIETAALDARFLVEGLSGLSGAELIRADQDAIDERLRERLEEACAERLAGRPVHRILGHREFYGLDLKLSDGTLEPRPDTETLVEAVLPFVGERVAVTGRCRILDLGTGTGAIGLAIVSAVPGAACLGVDISSDAVQTANRNAHLLDLAHVFEAQVGCWFDGFSGPFDLIVSNPPYIPSTDIAGLAREVREHDPVIALDGGDDGLTPYRIIAAQADRYLHAEGLIGLEAGAGQGPDIKSLFGRQGFVRVSSHRDFGGIERAYLFERSKVR